MRSRKTALAIGLALGLSYVPPAVYADHHEGSGIGHTASETKDAAGAAMEVKEEAKETATDTASETASEAAGKMEDKAGEAAKKMSEGSH